MENEYVIDKNKKYWVKLPPIDFIIGSFAVMSGNASDYEWVECEIDESRYKVSDGYKVEVKPIDIRFAKRAFYQDDFITMLERGDIRIADGKVKPILVKTREHLCGNAYIESEFCILAEEKGDKRNERELF